MARPVVIAIQIVAAACLVALAFVATGFAPTLLAAAYLAVVTPWLLAIDLREHRLPNQLVVPGIATGLLACAGEWLGSGRVPLVPLAAGVAYVAFLLLLHLIGGMGMGDVKLGAVLGLASWNLSVAVLSPVIAFLAGGLVAAALLVAGRRGRRIAFGPYLLGGYWLAVAIDVASRTCARA